MLRFVCNCCAASASAFVCVCVCAKRASPKLNEREQRPRDCGSGREKSVLPTTFIHFLALIHSYALSLSHCAALSTKQNEKQQQKNEEKTRSISFILTARVEEKSFLPLLLLDRLAALKCSWWMGGIAATTTATTLTWGCATETATATATEAARQFACHRGEP